MTLTLGAFHPRTALWLLPGKAQTWWKPCLTRSFDGTDTHAWYVAPTSDYSSYCGACRPGKPFVVTGPKAWIAEIREASEAGDQRRVTALLRGPGEIVAAPVFRPRDRADWQEFWIERAAIFEFVGGMSRAMAEDAARELAGEAP